MTDYVKYEQDGPIVTLTLNAPEKRNAISTFQDCDDVVAAVHRVNRDRSVRCVILTGAGTAFCAGGDLKAMRDRKRHPRGQPCRRAGELPPRRPGHGECAVRLRRARPSPR